MTDETAFTNLEFGRDGGRERESGQNGLFRGKGRVLGACVRIHPVSRIPNALTCAFARIFSPLLMSAENDGVEIVPKVKPDDICAKPPTAELIPSLCWQSCE